MQRHAGKIEVQWRGRFTQCASARSKYVRKALLKIHRIEFPFLLGGEKLAAQDVGADQRVATDDVLVQRGQERFVKFQLIIPGGAWCLVLQKLEIKRELRHLNSLRIDVDAIDVVEEDFALLLQ